MEKGQLGVELQVSLAEGQGVRLAAGRPQRPSLSVVLLQQHRHHLATRGATPHNCDNRSTLSGMYQLIS